MKSKGLGILIAILVIAVMLTVSIGAAFAEPNFILSGRDKVGTFGKDGKSARVGFINTTCIEGDTSNAFNTCITAVDPTADNVILYPDESGTVALTGASPVDSVLTDTKILVGNSAGTAQEQSHTLTGDVTGSMANSGALDTTITASAVLSSMIAIANVQASNMFINTVTLVIEAGTVTNAVAVEAGSILIYALPSSGFSNVVGITNVSYGGGVEAANMFRVDTDAYGVADRIVDTLWIRP